MHQTVSIIMPCYNAEKTITESINSVIAQTYSDWELLICDDCSTDKSIEVINSFISNDSRIKLFKTEFQSGSPAEPRNICIKKATGRYIAFLDSDDLWIPTKLEKQIPLFSDDEIAIVYSNYEKIDENGVKKKRIITSPLFCNYKYELGCNVIGNLTGIYDINKCGKIFQKPVGHEDYLVWLTILEKGYIAKNQGEVLAQYRQTATSLSGNKLQAAKWVWNIYWKELNFSFIKTMFYFIKFEVKGFLKFIK